MNIFFSLVWNLCLSCWILNKNMNDHGPNDMINMWRYEQGAAWQGFMQIYCKCECWFIEKNVECDKYLIWNRIVNKKTQNDLRIFRNRLLNYHRWDFENVVFETKIFETISNILFGDCSSHSPHLFSLSLAPSFGLSLRFDFWMDAIMLSPSIQSNSRPTEDSSKISLIIFVVDFPTCICVCALLIVQIIQSVWLIFFVSIESSVSFWLIAFMWHVFVCSIPILIVFSVMLLLCLSSRSDRESVWHVDNINLNI